MDCGTDLVVGPTTADVGNRPVNILIGRLGIAFKHGGGRHDHSRLTVTALGHVMFDPGLLHGVERISGQTLDGVDGLPLGDAYGCDAAP